MRLIYLIGGLCLSVCGIFSPAVLAASLDDLVRAYPDSILGHSGGHLIWHDGSQTPLGQLSTSAKTRLTQPSLADQLDLPYPPGSMLDVPSQDPGRSRNAAFFDKLYGDCAQGGVASDLVDVAWLPSHHGGTLRFNQRHGAAEALSRVSLALDQLPSTFTQYLIPSAGGYNCRKIAGTQRKSPHAYGIAIDIAVSRANYWRWSKPSEGAPVYQNQIPEQIVTIFERHGFIWGGKWRHFDTMHFEYRPEMFNHDDNSRSSLSH